MQTIRVLQILDSHQYNHFLHFIIILTESLQQKMMVTPQHIHSYRQVIDGIVRNIILMFVKGFSYLIVREEGSHVLGSVSILIPHLADSIIGKVLIKMLFAQHTIHHRTKMMFLHIVITDMSSTCCPGSSASHRPRRPFRYMQPLNQSAVANLPLASRPSGATVG